MADPVFLTDRLEQWAEAKPDETAVRRREQLAAYKCPTSVDILDALPRNPTGKILKRDLRRPYWEGRDRTIV